MKHSEIYFMIRNYISLGLLGLLALYFLLMLISFIVYKIRNK